LWRKIRLFATGLRYLRFRFRYLGGNDSMDPHTRAKRHVCVAHRGFSGQAPENTMAAFRMALDLPHVTWMELDVHLSKDEVPVVIHDGTLDRTTNAKGRVIDYTAEELGRVDAGSRFDGKFSSEGIPTLDEVLVLADGRCTLNIELKGDDADYDRLAQRAVEAVRARGKEGEHVITSFREDILKAVRKVSPSIRTGLITSERPADLIGKVVGLGCSYLSIAFNLVDEKLLKEASEASVEVMAWTVNSASDLRRLADRPEQFQLCTNYPDRWLKAIKGEQ